MTGKTLEGGSDAGDRAFHLSMDGRFSVREIKPKITASDRETSSILISIKIAKVIL